jgi:hypothetical protein
MPSSEKMMRAMFAASILRKIGGAIINLITKLLEYPKQMDIIK